MSVKRISGAHQPTNDAFKSLGEIAVTLQKCRELRNELDIITIKDIAGKALSDIGTPSEFNKLKRHQKDYIFDVQFKKVSAEELKPYLLIDKVYMIHHFQDGLIPEDFYYSYDAEKNILHLSSEHLHDDQLKTILTDLKEEVKTSLQDLDLHHFHLITTLEVLSPLNLEKLQRLDCSYMHQLNSLVGLTDTTKLKSLVLNSCGELKSLMPLMGKSVVDLDLTDCYQIEDYRPLLEIKDLKRVHLSGCNHKESHVFEVIHELELRGVEVADLDAVGKYAYNKWLKRHDQELIKAGSVE